MKRILLILLVFAVSCIILSQGGCEGSKKSVPAVQAPAADKPAAEPVTPKPVTDKPAVEPVTPKPTADKPVRVVEKPAPKPDDGKGPRIKFDKLIHDFGNIDPGSSNICEFPFKNVGNALLKIIKVKPGCGCTIATPLKKKEYAPGESGVMKFKYNAALRAGAQSNRIVVTTNDTVKSVVTLTLKARIVDQVSYEPKILKLLLKGNDDKLPKVTLTSLDGKPFKIKSIKSSLNSISAQFNPEVEATKFVLELTVDKDQLRKVTSGRVRFSLTHPAARNISIPFSVLTRFKLNRSRIFELYAEPGKPIIRNVTILNNYQEDFEIASVKSKTGITKVIKQEKIRYGYTFSLQITPPDTASGTKRFSDVVTITVKGGESLTMTCTGFYNKRKKN